MLRKDEDGLISYNYSKIIATSEEKTYEILKSN